MVMRLMLFIVVLGLGGTLGWRLANHWGGPDSAPETITTESVHSAVAMGRIRVAHETAPEERPSLTLATAQGDDPEGEDARWADVLVELQGRLDQEAAQRRLLERRVQELNDKLARLENIAQAAGDRPLPAIAAASRPEAVQEDPAVRAQARTAKFLSVGFSEEDEQQLTRRMDEVEMERLYLRDRARREGWLRTPQYREAANELRNELRTEMGDDAYDRLLYASERNNRVLVDGVLASSPAQEIGLQSGDVIVSYDGTRVFSRRDIRTAARSGEAGDPVPLSVERNGKVLELEIPRGPIGVQLGSSSIMP